MQHPQRHTLAIVCSARHRPIRGRRQDLQGLHQAIVFNACRIRPSTRTITFLSSQSASALLRLRRLPATSSPSAAPPGARLFFVIYKQCFHCPPSPRLIFYECACSATSKFCGLLLPYFGSATSISLPWRSCCSAVVGHRVHVVGAPASAQALPDADRQLQSVCELLPPWLLPVAPPRSPCPGGAFALQLWAIGCMWWAHQPDMLVLWMLVGNCRDFCFRVCPFGGKPFPGWCASWHLLRHLQAVFSLSSVS